MSELSNVPTNNISSPIYTYVQRENGEIIFPEEQREEFFENVIKPACKTAEIPEEKKSQFLSFLWEKAPFQRIIKGINTHFKNQPTAQQFKAFSEKHIIAEIKKYYDMFKKSAQTVHQKIDTIRQPLRQLSLPGFDHSTPSLPGFETEELLATPEISLANTGEQKEISEEDILKFFQLAITTRGAMLNNNNALKQILPNETDEKLSIIAQQLKERYNEISKEEAIKKNEKNEKADELKTYFDELLSA